MPVEGRDLSSRQTQYVVKDMEIGKPINSDKCSEAADGVARESEGVKSCPLSAERGKAGTGNLRHPFVARVGNNMEQFGDSSTPDRRDNAELGKVSSDRINHRGLLAD